MKRWSAAKTERPANPCYFNYKSASIQDVYGDRILEVINKSEIYEETLTLEVDNLHYQYESSFVDNNNYNAVFIEVEVNGEYGYYFSSTNLNSGPLFYIPILLSKDISSLVYETQKRKLKRTDLTYSPETIEDMSKYYYTTLEYTYGSNDISGF